MAKGLLKRYTCKNEKCNARVTSLSDNGYCEDCEEKFQAGQIKKCEDCGKNIGPRGSDDKSSKLKCFNCNLEAKICTQCGVVSDKELDNNGICEKCTILNSSIECQKCGKLTSDIMSDQITNYEIWCSDCFEEESKKTPQENKNTQTIANDNSNVKKKDTNMILYAIAILVLLLGAYFLTQNSSSDTNIVKNEHTKTLDTIPDNFAFIDQKNVNLNSEIISNEITLTGINAPTEIKISNGKYSINGSSWSNTISTVTNESKLKVKHQSSNNYNSITTTNITIGGVNGTFVSTTKSKPSVTPVPNNSTLPICTSLQRAMGQAEQGKCRIK